MVFPFSCKILKTANYIDSFDFTELCSFATIENSKQKPIFEHFLPTLGRIVLNTCFMMNKAAKKSLLNADQLQAFPDLIEPIENQIHIWLSFARLHIRCSIETVTFSNS